MAQANHENHLDLLGLDAVRAGEGLPSEKAHAEACAACRAALEDLRRLAADLEALGAAPLAVPRERDRAILAMARAAIARGRAPSVFRFRRILAAAAALVAAAGLGLWLAVQSGAPELARGEPWDLDRSGRVDILDAYGLALRIRDGAILDPRWDLNRDGAVDRLDVELVARESVSLKRRRP
jgi:hypothetical protein